MSTLYEINCTGITCSSCGTKVKKNVSKLSGVSEVSVNVLDGKVIVRITEGTRIESVVEELKSLSFGVSAAPTKVV
jgi:Cu+-exporting ATPase